MTVRVREGEGECELCAGVSEWARASVCVQVRE
jgi:hypothetical protein